MYEPASRIFVRRPTEKNETKKCGNEDRVTENQHVFALMKSARSQPYHS
jgi:hypothetical protein